ncbi:MAG: glycine zipper 2TM domain-containing protein [Alphaproteobacteria bacterium]|nr:glycine zipper 2TM domain-containing protein [Alphaproteobacteria bacterium]
MRAPTLAFIVIFSLTTLSVDAARADSAELIGTGLGMAMGGLVGSQFGKGSGQLVSTGVGVAVGGAIGNSIVQDMEKEPSYAPSTYAPSGEPAPVVFNSYTPNYVAPPAPPPASPTTYVDKDTYCRPYSQEIKIDGQVQESFGTACLQPDGTWRIVQ